MAEVVRLAEKTGEEDDEGRKEESVSLTSPRSIWSGSLRIGLVNIPVKAATITKDLRVKLRMLHRDCRTPITYKRFCQEGVEVPITDIVYGYPLGRNRYVVLEKKEIDEAKPASKSVIELDRFINFFEVDPHYFDNSYVLLPDRSEEAYALLMRVMEETGKAALGRITMHSRERIVLVHFYRQAIVATTLRYPDEVLDPGGFAALRELPVPGEQEISLAKEIVKGLTGDLDFQSYKDGFRERMGSLVKSKMEGIVVAPEKKRARPAARSLMEALRKTAESIKGPV